jgi:nucleoside-diphosphate-sugar epimerase
MRYVLTGAAGFIGSHLAQALADHESREWSAVVRSALPSNDDRLKNVVGAVAAERAANEVLDGLNIPGSTKEIDRSKPLGICIVLPAQPGGEPEPTFLITKPFQRSTVKAAIAQALFFDAATVPAA